MMKKLLLNIFTSKILKTGAIKPLPGSGIVDEISETIAEIKKSNNYKRLIKMGAYIIVVTGMWYLIGKGVEATVSEQIILFEQIIGLAKFLLG